MAGESSSTARTQEKKRANSKDPGWKYSYWPDETDKNKVKCELCGLVSNGGIKRQKQHLVGGFSDVKKCPNSNKQIAEEMLSWMTKTKKRKSNPSCPVEGESSNDECTPEEPGNSTSSSLPEGSGTKLLEPNTQTKRPMDSFMGMGVEDFIDARRSGRNFKNMENRWKEEEKMRLDEYVATWFYEGGVPFDAARLRSFEVMIELVGRFGPGYKPPTYHMLRVPLLKRMVEKTEGLYTEYQKHWKMYGCTIMCDEWTDKRQRKLINFLVNCPEGTYFVESMDASDTKEDASLICDLLGIAVEQIGEDNVVQVVFRNTSHNISAGRLLMEKRKKLFCTPCVAHCLDFILEDISKLKTYKGAISKAKKLTTYIYTHSHLLKHMRKEAKGKELLRYGITRFATTFLTLERLNDDAIKWAIRKLFSSNSWHKSVWASTSAGKNVSSIVFQVKFWHEIEDILRASQPILQVLRLVDGDEKPAMGYIYAAMECAKQQIVENFGFKKTKFQPILKIVDKRWENQMHHPLYAAGFFLNPKLYFNARQKDASSIGKFVSGFFTCLERMIPDIAMQDEINDQLALYMNERGLFGKEITIRARERRLPTEWWMQYGGETPELRQVALRILGLCCRSSGSELNRSTFEFIHTKKMNRLEHKRLNDFMYVQYNHCLYERFRETRNHPDKYDPICIPDLDWGSKWMTKRSLGLVRENDNSYDVEDDWFEEIETDDHDVPWESDGDEDDKEFGDAVAGPLALEQAIFGFKI